MVVQRPSGGRLAARRLAERSEYSTTLGRLARFTLAHRFLVIGAWVAVGIVLAILFPSWRRWCGSSLLIRSLLGFHRFKHSIRWVVRSVRRAPRPLFS